MQDRVTGDGHVSPPSESAGMEDFLRDLGLQRTRLETLVSSTSALDLTEILSMLSTLSERLIVAEQELRSQTGELEVTTARVRQLTDQWEQISAALTRLTF